MFLIPFGACLFHDIHQLAVSWLSVFITPLWMVVLVVRTHYRIAGTSSSSSHENFQIFHLFCKLQTLTAHSKHHWFSLVFHLIVMNSYRGRSIVLGRKTGFHDRGSQEPTALKSTFIVLQSRRCSRTDFRAGFLVALLTFFALTLAFLHSVH